VDNAGACEMLASWCGSIVREYGDGSALRSLDTPTIEFVGFLLLHAAETCHRWLFHFRSRGHAIGLLPLTPATFRPYRMLYAPFTSAFTVRPVLAHL